MLIDTGSSFIDAVKRGVESEWRRAGFVVDADGYGEELYEVFKTHGSFNDDYAIAWCLLNISAQRADASKKLSQALPSASELAKIVSTCRGRCVEWLRDNYEEFFELDHVRALCENIYLGCAGEPGASSSERPMLDVHWSALPLPVYIYTGRDSKEWAAGKKTLGWIDFPDERAVLFDSGMLKPSPAGLEYICKKFGHSNPLFFGDTMSDKLSHIAFGRGEFVAIGKILQGEANRFDNVKQALISMIGMVKDEKR